MRIHALLAAAVAALAAPASAQPLAQAGALACDIGAGIGLIVTSQREMICTFRNVAGELEVYTGTIRRFGIDLGATAGGQMVWSVLAPSTVVRGALAGEYAGAGAEASVGAGLGANVLLGGSNRSVALQPLSVQGQAGLNLAAGVTSLELRPGQPIR
ncbi:MAG TPA: DUF992 domain-containing protein [Beijerinckiaceae bacterium]|nr:DUF992 domain-containing protein [Beijerinckiaceae bacterium]